MARWGKQASRKPNTKKTKRFGGFGFRTEDCVFLVYRDFCGQKGKNLRLSLFVEEALTFQTMQ